MNKKDEEFIKFHSDRLAELPTDILNKAIKVLNEELDEKTKDKIRADIKKDPIYWFAPYHHGWGTAIRNLLRNKVCLDDKLSLNDEYKNWDNYYVLIVEIVVHHRMYA